MNVDIGILLVLILLFFIFCISLIKTKDTYTKAVFCIQVTFIGGIIVLKAQDLVYELIGYGLIVVSLFISIMAAAESKIKNE